jgi:3-dehydroquinate synthetase
LIDLYHSIGLPVSQAHCAPDELLAAVEGTRRQRGGALNLVVPTAVGAVEFVQQVGHDELAEAVAYFASLETGRRGRRR